MVVCYWFRFWLCFLGLFVFGVGWVWGVIISTLFVVMFDLLFCGFALMGKCRLDANCGFSLLLFLGYLIVLLFYV